MFSMQVSPISEPSNCIETTGVLNCIRLRNCRYWQTFAEKSCQNHNGAVPPPPIVQGTSLFKLVLLENSMNCFCYNRCIRFIEVCCLYLGQTACNNQYVSSLGLLLWVWLEENRRSTSSISSSTDASKITPQSCNLWSFCATNSCPDSLCCTHIIYENNEQWSAPKKAFCLRPHQPLTSFLSTYTYPQLLTRQCFQSICKYRRAHAHSYCCTGNLLLICK